MADKRLLGSTGLLIPPLCFGGNVLGWTADQDRSFQLLDALMARGLNFVDTADVYSRWVPGHVGGESETILGNWMHQRKNRDQVVVATKVGNDMGNGNVGLKKDYILREVEQSLGRLQTDYIDLYQSHKDDASTGQEETLRAYEQLIKQGKVRAIGASNFSGARLEEAAKISTEKQLPRYATLQPLYNLYDRADFERDLLPVCQREKIVVIPYYSLASGFLTGKYRSEADLKKSPRGQGIGKKYMNPRGMKILGALDEVSKRLKSTPAQVSLAWLLTRPTIAAPIASATNLDQVQQLISATELQIDSASLDILNTASA